MPHLRSSELIFILRLSTSVSLRLRRKAHIVVRKTRSQFLNRSRRATLRSRKTPTLMRREKTKERTKLCREIRHQDKLQPARAQHKEPVLETKALSWTLARLQLPHLVLSMHSNSLQLEPTRKMRKQRGRSLQAQYLRVECRDFS